MNLISNITVILAVAGVTFTRVNLHHPRADELRKRILLEQEKYNTCTCCYRDFAYEETTKFTDLTDDTQKSQFLRLASPRAAHGPSNPAKHITMKCKYCGHIKVVSNAGLQDHHN